MIEGTAVVDGEYRYRLTREASWCLGEPEHRTVTWIMLNPSTAGASEDDPTIRRVRGFSDRETYGRIVVVNLFARRCTRPVHLLDPGDPVGPDNDRHLADALGEADLIVAAWGASGPKYQVAERVAAIRPLFAGLTIHCLGMTAFGAPRHPLYVRADAPLQVWQGVC